MALASPLPPNDPDPLLDDMALDDVSGVAAKNGDKKEQELSLTVKFRFLSQNFNTAKEQCSAVRHGIMQMKHVIHSAFPDCEDDIYLKTEDGEHIAFTYLENNPELFCTKLHMVWDDDDDAAHVFLTLRSTVTFREIKEEIFVESTELRNSNPLNLIASSPNESKKYLPKIEPGRKRR